MMQLLRNLLMIFVLALVDVSFSGYMVPIDRLPVALQILSQFFPLQHYLVIIRAVMLKGAGLPLLMNQVLALAALAVGGTVVALATLRGRLD